MVYWIFSPSRSANPSNLRIFKSTPTLPYSTLPYKLNLMLPWQTTRLSCLRTTTTQNHLHNHMPPDQLSIELSNHLVVRPPTFLVAAQRPATPQHPVKPEVMWPHLESSSRRISNRLEAIQQLCNLSMVWWDKRPARILLMGKRRPTEMSIQAGQCNNSHCWWPMIINPRSQLTWYRIRCNSNQCMFSNKNSFKCSNKQRLIGRLKRPYLWSGAIQSRAKFTTIRLTASRPWSASASLLVADRQEYFDLQAADIYKWRIHTNTNKQTQRSTTLTKYADAWTWGRWPMVEQRVEVE